MTRTAPRLLEAHPEPADDAVPDGPEEASRWRAIPRAKTYELVIDRIEEQILSGQLRVGDKLPPERDLASLLGVSRSAVREAIRVLQAQGVLRSTVGNGPESGTMVSGSSGQALNRLLRLQVALTNFPVEHVVEARVMLERWSVRLAAESAGPAELATLRELLAEMDDPSTPRSRFNDLDTRFHVAVAEAGGNRLVADLTAAVRESLRFPLLAAFEELTDWPAVAAGLRAEHHRLYDQIAAGDGAAAAGTVEAHLRDSFARLGWVVGAVPRHPFGGGSRRGEA
jgi:GntR family transcriptional regulator, transcriptional repressor for pyruvate dehydrogenase complex